MKISNLQILARVLILIIFLIDIASASDYIKATKVPGNLYGIDSNSKAWLSTDYTEIQLYPIVMTEKNDNNLSELSTEGNVKKIKVKALYDGENIALLLKWKDDDGYLFDTNATNQFADGFSMQFSTVKGDLPYVDMGSKNRAVVIYELTTITNIQESNITINGYQTYADENNTNTIEPQKQDINTKKIESNEYRKILTAEGFEKTKEINPLETKFTINMIYKNGYWFGSLTRKLNDKFLRLNNGSFPISFTIYDDSKQLKNKFKKISPWIAVKLVGEDGGEALIEKLTQKIKGDIIKGKKIAATNCAICHRYKATEMAPRYMAPDLSYIGGYSDSSYLIESLVKPSAVIVEDHTTKTNTNFAWQGTTETGKSVSTMPSFEWMSEQEMNDLIAFLQTLK